MKQIIDTTVKLRLDYIFGHYHIAKVKITDDEMVLYAFPKHITRIKSMDDVYMKMYFSKDRIQLVNTQKHPDMKFLESFILTTSRNIFTLSRKTVLMRDSFKKPHVYKQSFFSYNPLEPIFNHFKLYTKFIKIHDLYL